MLAAKGKACSAKTDPSSGTRRLRYIAYSVAGGFLCRHHGSVAVEHAVEGQNGRARYWRRLSDAFAVAIRIGDRNVSLDDLNGDTGPACDACRKGQGMLCKDRSVERNEEAAIHCVLRCWRFSVSPPRQCGSGARCRGAERSCQVLASA